MFLSTFVRRVALNSSTKKVLSMGLFRNTAATVFTHNQTAQQQTKAFSMSLVRPNVEQLKDDIEVAGFKPEMYMNSITLTGEVCWEPQPNRRIIDHEIYGYHFGVITKQLIHSQNGPKFVRKTRTQVRCYMKDMLEAIGTLEIGDRVCVTGQMKSHLTREGAQTRRRHHFVQMSSIRTL